MNGGIIILKKYFMLLLLLCFTLVGCSGKEDTVKGAYDRKGVITEIDVKGNRILVDDIESGLIWIDLHENGNLKNYEEGQEVVIWIDGGIDTSLPASAKALNIEHTTPSQ